VKVAVRGGSSLEGVGGGGGGGGVQDFVGHGEGGGGGKMRDMEFLKMAGGKIGGSGGGGGGKEQATHTMEETTVLFTATQCCKFCKHPQSPAT